MLWGSHTGGHTDACLQCHAAEVPWQLPSQDEADGTLWELNTAVKKGIAEGLATSRPFTSLESTMTLTAQCETEQTQ